MLYASRPPSGIIRPHSFSAVGRARGWPKFNPSDPINNGLMAYYPMDGASAVGTVLSDVTRNRNTGTIVSAPPVVRGVTGNALSFTAASSQYVDLQAPASLELYSTVSVSAWINYPTSISGPDFVVAKDFSSGTRGYCLGVSGDKVYAENNGGATCIGGTTLKFNTWYHVGAVFNFSSNISYAFLNGARDSGTTSAGVTANTLAHWNIGRRAYVGANQYFNGIIDEVRIWNRVLSDSEWRRVGNDRSGTLGLLIPNFSVGKVAALPGTSKSNFFFGA